MKGVIVPSILRGNGGGHLKRALNLASRLEQWKILLLYDENSLSSEEVHSMIDHSQKSLIYTHWEEVPRECSTVLLDQRNCSPSLYTLCRQSFTHIIALDEGGERRSDMDYLIDSLPGASDRCEGNIFSSEYLFFNEAPEITPWLERKKILLTFGNEDQAGLTNVCLEFLLKNNLAKNDEITVVKGPLCKKFVVPDNIEVLDSPENLPDLLNTYKFVITSIGITAYEAQRAGSEVLLLNPSPYHEKISRNSGFTRLGMGKISLGGMKQLQKKLTEIAEPPLTHRENGEESPLVSLLNQLDLAGGECPCCENTVGMVLHRFKEGSYRICPQCGNTYYQTAGLIKEEYSSSYFFEDYKKQYGKTYLEDFDHIKSMGYDRLRQIEKMIQPQNGELCDLGCAYGPFLTAARERGFSVRGVDISPHAVQWVSQELSIPAWNYSLLGHELDELLTSTPSDVITLWYVIEHMRDQQKLINSLSRWIKRGGVLAFSTPNGRGISARKNLKNFLRQSPEDHFIIYNPKSAAKVLRKGGFKVEKIRITGHHPERISPALAKGNLGFKLLMGISRLFKLGDTFEIYARKER